MAKAIISSMALSNFLSAYLNLQSVEGNRNHKLIFADNRLNFIDYYKGLDIQSKPSEWEIDVQTNQLRKLLKVVSAIEEQPITIDFKDNNSEWITVLGIVM